jgi:hypothetical protein
VRVFDRAINRYLFAIAMAILIVALMWAAHQWLGWKFNPNHDAGGFMLLARRVA